MWDLLPRRIISVAVLVLIFALAISGQISTIPDSMSQTGLGGINSIVGMVFAPNGQPIESRVRVRLSSMTSGDRYTTTNENGSYAFRGLPAGGYTISVEKEKEFEPVSQTIDIIQFRGAPAQTYTLNLRLVAKSGAAPRNEVVNAELAGVPKPALDLYNKAIELIKAGDRKGAVEQFRLAVAEHPDFMLAYNEMGVQYTRLGELEKAADAFKAAAKIRPEAFDPQMNLGVVLYHRKLFDQAEPAIRAAVKLKEDSASAHYYLGMTLANLGRFDEAEKELLLGLKLGGDQMNEGRRVLAIIYASRGERKKASDELEKYLKVSPKADDAEQIRARIQQLKQQ